ncbi:MAG: DMT family transporter [Lachnospiraceae bacterium]|nr:DMT family transporter [Lachnospiraceae bacterium]
MKAKQTTFRYLAGLIFAILMFSTFEVASKSMHGCISSFQLTFYRFLIGGIVLIPFAVKEIKKRDIHFSAKDHLVNLVMGFLLVFASMAVTQIGLQMSSASLTAIIFSSNPLFISLFSAIILKEKLTSGKIIGLIVGIIGLFVTCSHIFSMSFDVDSSFIVGVALIFLGMIVFSLYTVLNKPRVKKYGSITCTTLSSIYGAITIIPLLIFTGIKDSSNPFAFDFQAVWPQFLFVAIFVTGIAYYFYFDALSNLDTAISSMSFFIKPPLASFMCYLLLKEDISINSILGIVIIFIAVFISMKFGANKASK